MEITKHEAYAHFAKNRCECGVMTTDHPASSYGLPVFVATDGRAFGPAEVEAVSLGLDVDLFGEDVSEFERRIAESGYVLRA